ncbi:hypothetical protein W97_03491 [Coniosporium apollinis CBS 100218]|uniref:Uncharacterized protein n=1 Tax=Coniosporium apollinis (strain CBS 100218) TaxID=1168221 RepID=R7YQR1_CONA1|nr:uncharacterized protein W97_03491 [Coniosporium apollinis CBS 100218]EON64260.1 hypothetical protein W97_03491 [Coniosporium apollinis CBS 100218]
MDDRSLGLKLRIKDPHGLYCTSKSGPDSASRAICWDNKDYTVTRSGTNSQGNHYCNRDYGPGAADSYHYSNRDGSYFYQNPDGSTYYNNGKGYAKFEKPDGGR